MSKRAEREVKSEYPSAVARPYAATQGRSAFAIAEGPDPDAPWLGTGLTEKDAWDDAYRGICFAAFARNNPPGEPRP